MNKGYVWLILGVLTLTLALWLSVRQERVKETPLGKPPPAVEREVARAIVPSAESAPARDSATPEPSPPVEMERFTLALRVTDNNDEPIDGAALQLGAQHPNSAVGAELPQALEARTRADGSWEFEGLIAGAYFLYVHSMRHAKEGIEVEVPLADALAVKLRSAAHLVGRAFLRDRNHPLCFGTIEYSLADADGSFTFLTTPDHRTRTDSDARFFVGPLPAGKQTITLQYRDFRLQVLEVSVVRGQDNPEVEVVFQDGIVARGTVQGRQSVILPDARLFWRQAGSHRSTRLECRTDTLGRFEQGGLQPGPYVVEVYGFAMEEDRTQELLLGESPEQEVSVTVNCSPGIPVRVVTHAGAPASDAWLRCDYVLPLKSGSVQADPIDTQGWTRTPCVVPGAKLTIDASLAEHGSARHVVTAADINAPIVLRLEREVRVAGSVVTPHWEPVPDAVVAAVDTEVDSARALTAKSGADGRFELSLPAGRYVVAANDATRGQASAEIVVDSGETPEELRLELTSDPARSLIVRVLGPGGVPLEGARVTVYCNDRTRDSRDQLRSRLRSALGEPVGLTDASGRFVAQGLEGECYLHATYGDLVELGRRAKVPVPSPHEVEIQLERPEARSVSGVVLCDGQPVGGAHVRCVGEGKAWVGSSESNKLGVTDEAGRYVVNGIPETSSAVTMIAWGETFAVASSELLMLPRRGKVTDVPVNALDGGDLCLKLEDSQGNSPGHVRIELTRTGGPPIGWSAPTAMDGTLCIPRLPVGDYTLRLQAQSDDYLPSQQISWVPGGDRVTLRLEAQPR
jgi:protocatechuate 3,4-dioxygenase beta subunit